MVSSADRSRRVCRAEKEPFETLWLSYHGDSLDDTQLIAYRNSVFTAAKLFSLNSRQHPASTHLRRQKKKNPNLYWFTFEKQNIKIPFVPFLKQGGFPPIYITFKPKTPTKKNVRTLLGHKMVEALSSNIAMMDQVSSCFCLPVLQSPTYYFQQLTDLSFSILNPREVWPVELVSEKY